MAEALRIEIDVTAAKAALESLKGSFAGVKSAVDSSLNGSNDVIKRFNDALSAVKGLDSKVTNSLSALSQALSSIRTDQVVAASAALDKLGATDVSKAAQATKAMSDALAGIKTPEGVERISVSFGKAGDAAKQADAHVRAFVKSQNDGATAAQTLGRELINAAGFMGGLGVTAGKIVEAFGQIQSSGIGVTGAVSAIVDKFGVFGAAAAAVAGVAVVFNALSAAVVSLVQPLIEVQQKFVTFTNVLDSLAGKGAGAIALDQLRKTAQETGTDLNVLVKNATGLSTAMLGTGQSISQVTTVTKQFSAGLSAMGASSQQSEKAFLALTQMFSKGKVQLEELRGQLGDALPGAFSLAAEAMGVTTASLEQLLKSGSVLAQDLVPALGKLLEVKFGDAIVKQSYSATAAINRFNNAVLEIQNAFGSGNFAGVVGGAAVAINAFAQALAAPGVTFFARALGDLIGVFIALTGSLTGGLLNGFTSFLTAIEFLADGARKLIEVFLGVVNIGASLASWFKTANEGLYALASAAGFALTAIFGLGTAAAAFGAIASATGTAVAFLTGSLVGQAVIGTIATAWGTYTAALNTAKTAALAWAAADVAILASVGGWGAAIGGAVASLGRLISSFSLAGVAAGIYAAAQSVATAATVAWGTVVATVSGASLASLISGLGAAAAAAGRFAIALAFNPIVLALVASLAVLAGSMAFFTQTGREFLQSVTGLQTSFGGLAAAASATKSPIENTAEAIKKQGDALRSQPELINQAATSFFGLEQAQARAAATSARLEASIRQSNHSIRDATASQANAERQQQAYTRGISMNNQEMEKQILKNQRIKQDLQEIGVKYSAADTQTRKLQRAIKDNNEAIQNSNLSFAEAKQRNDDWVASIKEGEERMKMRNELIKQYKIELSAASVAQVQELEQLGLAQAKAVELVAAYERLTAKPKELAASIQEETARMAELNRARNDKIVKVQEEVKVLEARLGKDKETDAVLKREIATRQTFITTQQKENALTVEATTAREVWNAVLNRGMTVSQAIATVTDEMTKKFGGNKDAAAAAAKAYQDYTAEGKKVGEDAAKSGGMLAKLVEWFTRSSSEADKAGTNIKKASEAIGQSQATVDTATGSYAKLGTSFTAIGTGASTLATTIQPSVAGIVSLGEAITNANGPFTAFNENMTLFNTTLASVAPLVPTTATAFVTMSGAVVAMNEPLNAVTTNLTKFAEAAPGITLVQTSLIELSKAIPELKTTLEGGTTAMANLAAQGAVVAAGFEKAGTGASNFASQINTMLEAVNQAITRFGELKRAAEEALAAINAANAAQSGGKDKGQRDGGYSSESFKMAPNAINHMSPTTPQFREGTANTSMHASKLPGGGIPSILHPNEAVVPLKGRSIPVDLNLEMTKPTTGLNDTAPAPIDLTPLDKLSSAIESLSGSVDKSNKVAANVMTMAATAPMSDRLQSTAQTTQTARLQIDPIQTIVNMDAPKVPNAAELAAQRPVAANNEKTSSTFTGNERQRAATGGSTTSSPQTNNITITVNATDVDSFKRSEDQIVRSLSDKIRRANKRNG